MFQAEYDVSALWAHMIQLEPVAFYICISGGI